MLAPHCHQPNLHYHNPHHLQPFRKALNCSKTIKNPKLPPSITKTLGKSPSKSPHVGAVHNPSIYTCVTVIPTSNSNPHSIHIHQIHMYIEKIELKSNSHYQQEEKEQLQPVAPPSFHVNYHHQLYQSSEFFQQHQRTRESLCSPRSTYGHLVL